MSFAVHTFETHTDGKNHSFAFHENVGEGQEIYFLGKFSDDTTDAQSIAEALFGAVVDGYRQSTVTDSYEKFENGLKLANTEAQKSAAKLADHPDVVIALFDFHNLYLTQAGQAEAYLVRGDTLSQISEPGEDSDLFTNILSGQVSIDDTVMMASSRVLRSVTTSQLVEMFARSDFDESAALLRHELTNNAEEGIVVTTIGIGKKSKSGVSGFLSKMVSKVTGETAPADVETEEVDENSSALAKASADTAEVSDDMEMPTDLGLDIAPDSRSHGKMTEPTPPKSPRKKLRLPNFKGQNPLQGTDPKTLKTAAMGILAIILISVGIQFIVNYESTETAELRAELDISKESLAQAKEFLIQSDRQSATELLGKAQKSAQKVLNSQSKDFRFTAQTLLAEIQEEQMLVENARKVDPQVLADLGVKNDNIQALGLVELKGSLHAYDTRNVYKTIRNIVEKGIQISESESVLAASTRPDQNTILFLTDGPRIVESKNGVIYPMSTDDESWKKGADIKTYGRFVYVLDPVENQIWKYQRKSANYSEGTAYNQGADLSRAVSFAIDGSIYVLSDDGSLQKIFRGAKAEYRFRDLPSTPFEGKNIKIYTSRDLDNLYVLDPENTRILIFTKGEQFATYKKQVIFDKLSNVRDFTISESGQKASVITEDKIYEFPL